jgi:tetratricopeptide (TPR) repeat protein
MMRPKKGEFAYTVQERILLHIGEHPIAKESAIPHEVTQVGISLATGLRVGNVARALKRMVQEGTVQHRKARPYGKSHVSNCYRLTPAGITGFLELMARARDVRIDIRTPSGELRIPLADVPAYVPSGCSISEVVKSLRFGVLDVNEVEKSHVKLGPMGYASRDLPSPGDFFGRENECEAVACWWASPGAKILSLTGVAGIGKTSMMAKMARDWSMRSNVCWISVRRWTSVLNAATELSAFLASLGRKRTSSAVSLPTCQKGAVFDAIAADVRGLKAVFIFDDTHMAVDDGMAELLDLMCDIAKRECEVKVALVSRASRRAFDARSLLDGTATEIMLGPLDSEASRQILKSRHIQPGRLLKVCGGHPLFLKLASEPGERLTAGLAQYLEAEVLPNLSEEEWNAIHLISLAREPLPFDALVGPLGVKRGTIELLEGRGVTAAARSNTVRAHDIISEYAIRRMARPEREEAHHALGMYYKSCIGPSSGLEAIHHMCKAGRNDEAKRLFTALADELISKGFVRGLDGAVDEMCRDRPEGDRKMLLAMGRVYYHVGRWGEASNKIGAALALAREARSDSATAEALCAFGELRLRMGRRREAATALNESVRISTRIGDARLEAHCRYLMGSMLETEDPRRAEEEFEIARALAESCGSSVELALAFYGKGRLEERRGSLVRARHFKARALKLLDGSDQKNTVLKLLMSLGTNSFMLKDINGALESYQRAVAIARETGNVPMEGMALANLGGALIEKPDLRAAEDSLILARDMLEGIGDARTLSRVNNNLSLVFYNRANYARAVEYARSGLALAESLGDPSAVGRALLFLGKANAACGSEAEAREEARRATEMAAKAGDNQLKKEILKDFPSLRGRAARR